MPETVETEGPGAPAAGSLPVPARTARVHDAGSGRNTSGCSPGPSHFSRVAERLAAQRRAQRSGASPLKPRVRRELVDEPGHAATIPLGRAAVQRVGARVCGKPLRRKGRVPLRRDLGRRRPGRNGCTMRVRDTTRVAACPAPHISRVSPNDQVQQRGRLERRHATKRRHAGPVCCNDWFGLSVVTRPSPDYVAPPPSTTRRTTLPWPGLC